MNGDSAELIHQWHTLLAPHSDSAQVTATGRALLASWAQPHRRYHNIAHLRDVLTHVDEFASARTFVLDVIVNP